MVFTENLLENTSRTVGTVFSWGAMLTITMCVCACACACACVCVDDVIGSQAGDIAAPWWYPNYDFDYALGLLTARAPRVVLFGDIPTLPITKQPSNNLFKVFVQQQKAATGSLAFLNTLQEDPQYRARRLAVEATLASLASKSIHCFPPRTCSRTLMEGTLGTVACYLLVMLTCAPLMTSSHF